MDSDNPIVGIAMGDPAGIGAEIIVAAYPAVREWSTPLVIGDAGVIERAIEVTGSELQVNRVHQTDAIDMDGNWVNVYDLDNVEEHEYGAVRASYGRASAKYTAKALQLVEQGDIDAVVGGPENRNSKRLAEVEGTNELLERYVGSDTYWLLLVKDDLRVSHVTTHIALQEVLDTISADQVGETISVTHEWLRYLGVSEPTIAVPGINPHAGYGGLIGTEESEVVEPAIERARDDGVDVHGPASPDAVFGRAAAGAYDGVVALYHDQGHIPVKTLGSAEGRQFSGAAVRIGLPMVFTTVAHGTSFDIAGSGTASADGMENAIRLAAAIATNHPATN